MQTSMTSMTSVVWGRLFETVYGDFRDFHGLAELGRPSLERARLARAKSFGYWKVLAE